MLQSIQCACDVAGLSVFTVARLCKCDTACLTAFSITGKACLNAGLDGFSFSLGAK